MVPGLNVALVGATGMIGQGVLTECLADRRVATVLAIGRTPLTTTHPKLRQQRHDDFTSWPNPSIFADRDAVFFCLGVTALGKTETEYHRITFHYTLATARAAAAAHPGIVFCYVSGQGTDRTEQGRQMWARVKGKTENALLALEGLDAYMIRAGYVQPGKGVKSKTGWYNLVYAVMKPVYPLLKNVAGNYMTSTQNVGRAMIAVTAHGSDQRVLENADINRLAAPPSRES